MSDEAALLAAIRANPEEDTPRLVYADWLDEQGGEANAARAEYIRLEIEHARNFPERRWSKAKADAQKRARQLFGKYYREWFPELYGRKNILRGGRGSPDMRRGFPYRLLIQATKLLEVGEQLVELAPITEVEFRDMLTTTVQQFAQSPWIRAFRKINLSGYDIPPTNWSPLADCPYLTETESLSLSGGSFDPTGGARVAAVNLVPKLRRFSLGARMSDDSLAKLFGGVAFTGLQELRIGGRRDTFGLPGVEAVAASKALAGLKTFDLPWQPIPSVLPAITKALFWPGLEDLRLLRCGLTDADVAEIVRRPPPLRALDLDDNGITAAGAKLLAESPMLATITNLNLSRNPLGDKGITALITSPHARNLQYLNVSSCKFGLTGLTALAESPHMANLRELIIYGNDYGLQGIKVLIASPHLGGLTYLSVGGETAAARKALKERFGAIVSF